MDDACQQQAGSEQDRINSVGQTAQYYIVRERRAG
jgi:hypothetical protein